MTVSRFGQASAVGVAYDRSMTYAVGLRLERIDDAIPTLLFYPTRAAEQREQLGPFPMELARDAPVVEGRLPPTSSSRAVPTTCSRLRTGASRPSCSTELDRLDLIDEYQFLVHPRIAGHGPTLYQSGLPSTRRLELVSAEPLRIGAVAMHYRRAR